MGNRKYYSRKDFRDLGIADGDLILVEIEAGSRSPPNLWCGFYKEGHDNSFDIYAACGLVIGRKDLKYLSHTPFYTTVVAVEKLKDKKDLTSILTK